MNSHCRIKYSNFVPYCIQDKFFSKTKLISYFVDKLHFLNHRLSTPDDHRLNSISNDTRRVQDCLIFKISFIKKKKM